MSRQRRGRSSAGPPTRSVGWRVWGTATTQAAAVVLLVAAPLIPSEMAAREGTAVVYTLLWLVLALVSAMQAALDRTEPRRAGWLEIAVIVLVGWYGLSAFWRGSEGHLRPALNLFWQWTAMAAGFWIVRRRFRDPRAIRALVVIGLALAASLAGFGLFQFAWRMPQLSRQYELDPEGTLELAGVYAPPGTPERKQFENRLASREPFATFALANSLAGLLVPWLLVGLAIVIAGRGEFHAWRVGLAWLLLLLILACLLLTKSRSAWLATIAGLVMLGLSGVKWSGGRVSRWGLAVTGLLVIGAVIAAGGLDPEVIAEAPLSVRYRLEYWQAAGGMIREAPWLGTAPGNFADWYNQYKLPQSSETVADPHNFLLELWATTGTPSVLALLAVAGFAFWKTRSHRVSEPLTREHGSPDAEGTMTLGQHPWSIYGGAAGGLLLAYPLGSAVGFFPDLEMLPLGLLIGGLVVVAFDPWVRRGQLPRGCLFIAVLALLVNLLAAGGLNYLGVAQAGWILLALAANRTENGGSPAPTFPQVRWLEVFVWFAILAAAYLTAYRPVLTAKARMQAAPLRRTPRMVDAELRQAAAADPAWSEPWEKLAAFRFQMWVVDPTANGWKSFVDAVEELVRRRPRASGLRQLIGDWYLAAYIREPSEERRTGMLRAYWAAVDLYPASNYLHAQLAWALNVAGDSQKAAAEAEKALNLDRLVPHDELKLSAQRVYDGVDPPGVGAGRPAEQAMRELRKSVQ